MASDNGATSEAPEIPADVALVLRCETREKLERLYARNLSEGRMILPSDATDARGEVVVGVALPDGTLARLGATIAEIATGGGKVIRVGFAELEPDTRKRIEGQLVMSTGVRARRRSMAPPSGPASGQEAPPSGAASYRVPRGTLERQKLQALESQIPPDRREPRSSVRAKSGTLPSQRPRDVPRETVTPAVRPTAPTARPETATPPVRSPSAFDLTEDTTPAPRSVGSATVPASGVHTPEQERKERRERIQKLADRAKYYKDVGLTDEYIRTLKRILEISPDNQKVLSALAEIEGSPRQTGGKSGGLFGLFKKKE